MSRRCRLRAALVSGVSVMAVLWLALGARPLAQSPQGRSSANTGPQPPTLLMPARFSALAVRTVSPSATVPIDITIQRWSTDAERERLLTSLDELGGDKLLSVLRSLPPIGRVSATGSVGFELRFAQADTLSTGAQRILIATDRPMSFWETTDRPRSSDYPFTVFELRVNSRGQGDGKITIAAKLSTGSDHRTLVLENFEDQPVLLQGLRRVSR